MGFFRDETDVLGLDYEPADPSGRVFLRRLSGSRAGRGGTLLAEAGESVLRPLSVRERIRQLNLSAVAFTDTLMVLHGLKPRQRKRGHAGSDRSSGPLHRSSHQCLRCLGSLYLALAEHGA